MSQKTARIYTSLAPVYNDLMKDVDYEDWADYVDAIIQELRPDAVSLLELACGTGKVAMYLEELDCYEITATDMSAEMLEIGERKARFRNMQIKWKQLDFYDIQLDETYDVVFSLFDSVNYIMNEADFLKMLANVEKVMHEDSIFIFDFTTPKHSEYVNDKLNTDGVSPDGIRFERVSYYVPSQKVHVSEFEIEVLDDDKITALRRDREVHRQRIYDLQEVKAIVAKSNFEMLAAYDDFVIEPAHAKTERVTMVLACRRNP
ncbi:MAG: class I SAM-dependent methyltransferase [Candidatus Cyclonatronum sp.]|uniref:class I SAM-dependent DNA methyltransferase n=1 Tax=Cyclonatronum sp. TaxID=3024185 RepID=UPI0025C47C1D|nr:class I SAM-dependent methyltransferase [Cyclonatronum sp.]MCC5933824.1 class I SAM-dependent methyltransferase [Balneolales bacterium]MCH8488035.1 class I SAM-dependent methyltransferase [Cyclonatronum sp.]